MWDVFKIRNLGEYHDLYVQSDTLLLDDVFEIFRNSCIDIYELGPSHFVSAPGLAWEACLKKSEVELNLLTDINMLLMIDEWIRGGLCQAVYRYAKANNKCMTNYNKSIKSSYLMYLDANDLYVWAMSQKFPVNNIKRVEDLSKFNESFLKNYD